MLIAISLQLAEAELSITNLYANYPMIISQRHNCEVITSSFSPNRSIFTYLIIYFYGLERHDGLRATWSSGSPF